ncbi:hypothetical protein P154DRAFT_466332, partial [Amniculicola lignicola CBS 123094]
NPPFDPIPTFHEITIFLRWFVRTRLGLLEACITYQTAECRLKNLKRAIQIHTHYTYSSLENRKFAHFIKTNLPIEENLSTDARPRPIAPLAVAEDLITFLWRCDEYEYPSSRSRLQLIFCIIIFAFLGTRPGEIIDYESYGAVNEGLQYQDLELFRNSTLEYKGFVLHIWLRN